MDRGVLKATRTSPRGQDVHDGVDFMPAAPACCSGYQFKSIARWARCVGPIVAVSGLLPAILWCFWAVFFIGWSAGLRVGRMPSRNDGLKHGGLSYKLSSAAAPDRLPLLLYSTCC